MLKDMHLVLIGASGSIGGHFLSTAISQEARVINIGRRPPNRDVSHIEADVCDLEAVQRAAERAIAELGSLDVVLNFSGTHHKPMDFNLDEPEESLRDFDRVIDVNLRGAFIVTLVFGRLLMAQRRGHLIHLCSNASRLSLYGSYAYNASKHGLEGLIKTAAAQFAPYRVRVNGVAPGTVETSLNRHLLRHPQTGNHTARAASILAHTPTKRFASLEGITETLLATCLPQRHLTGNVIFCDDGYNIEGHSWPEGTLAVYDGGDELAELYSRIDGEDKGEGRW
ncbi:MAG: SDR family oxidoreductase [Porticoccaceae bacterium]|nr:SDR family oxidoreductase [Porticoccaceae bacterium]